MNKILLALVATLTSFSALAAVAPPQRVPEPEGLVLLALGAAGLAAAKLRRRS